MAQLFRDIAFGLDDVYTASGTMAFDFKPSEDYLKCGRYSLLPARYYPGLRFINIDISSLAQIDNAALKIYIYQYTGSINFNLYGDDVDKASEWAEDDQPYQITKTTATKFVHVFKSGWKATNVINIIQEIISRPGWNSGNAIRFAGFPSGTPVGDNTFNIRSYEYGGASDFAQLVIDYTLPSLANSGDLFIHGYNNIEISGDLFIEGHESDNNNMLLYIDGIKVTCKIYACGDNTNRSFGVAAEINRVTSLQRAFGTLFIKYPYKNYPICGTGIAHRCPTTAACTPTQGACVDEDGNVWSVGTNTDYALGIGETNESFVTSIPIRVSGLPDIPFAGIRIGDRVSFAIAENGTVWGWGHNLHGELGIGNTQDQAIAQQVSGIVDTIDIDTDAHHTIFVTDSGTYACGEYDDGKLGIPDAVSDVLIPQRISGLNDVEIVDVACGNDTTMFLTSSGDVYFCGKNNHGLFGNGTAKNTIWNTPTLSISGSLYDCPTDITCDTDSSAFLCGSGHIHCAGYNRRGKFGNGATAGDYIDFITITGVPSGVNIRAGDEAMWLSCRDSASGVWAAGGSIDGEVGTTDGIPWTSWQQVPNTSGYLRMWGTEKQLVVYEAVIERILYTNNTINLYMMGPLALQTSGDLFIYGHDMTGRGPVNLFICGSGIIGESGNCNFFINGYEPKPVLACPILDPTASIQIKDSLIRIYQSRIDALINQLGKNVYLEFDPIREPCPNCWTSGTIISTPDGPRQIQDIIPGDRVFSPMGNICRVQGKFVSEYEGHLFNINCWGINTPEFMTAEHKLPIVRNMRKLYTQKQWHDTDYVLSDPPIELVEARNIQSGDALILPHSPHNKEDLKSINIDEFGNIDCSDNLLTFLGWWLAEGCVCKSKNTRSSCLCLCASREEAVADYLITVIKDIFGINGKKEFRPNADNLLIYFHSVKLVPFLTKFGHGAWNKAIPGNLWPQLSQRQLSVIFDAYTKGDGHIWTDLRTSTYERYSTVTTSKILAFQMFDCLTRENLLPSIYYRAGSIDKNNVNHRECWTLVWFPSRREQKNCVRNSTVGQLAKIRSIQQIYKKTMVYNLDIGIDHQYIANGVASKNCEYDVIRKRSTGIYKIGGPRPFARGRKCPYCKSRGFKETVIDKCIKCLIKWNPKDAENFGIAISQTKGIVRLKTYLTEADDLMRAKTVIVNHDIIDQMKLKVRLIQGPIPVGLREDRYCISFWELL